MDCYDEIVRYKSGLTFLKYLLNRLINTNKDKQNLEFIIKNKLLLKCKRSITKEVVSKLANISF